MTSAMSRAHEDSDRRNEVPQWVENVALRAARDIACELNEHDIALETSAHRLGRVISEEITGHVGSSSRLRQGITHSDR